MCNICISEKGLQGNTVQSHLSASEYFHRVLRCFELDTTHLFVTNAFIGAARSHADAGTESRVQRPMSFVLSLGEGAVGSYMG